MHISNYRIQPVREKLFELGFERQSPGVYFRKSDNQRIEINPPQHPSDNWSASVVESVR